MNAIPMIARCMKHQTSEYVHLPSGIAWTVTSDQQAPLGVDYVPPSDRGVEGAEALPPSESGYGMVD